MDDAQFTHRSDGHAAGIGLIDKVFRRRMVVPGSVVVALLVFNSVLLLGSLAWSRSADRWVEQSDKVIILSQEVGLVVQSIPIVHAAYMLTFDEFYLETYRTAQAELPQKLEALRAAVEDNDIQIKRAMRIDIAARQKLDESAKVLEIFESQGQSAALDYINASRAKNIRNEGKEAVNDFINAERALRRARSTSAKSAEAIIAIVVVFGSLCLALAALWAGRRVSDELERRMSTEHELLRHREALENTVVERTRDLSESLNRLHASERLASLGTLAAGLGHDLANLVLPIRARLESLSTSVSGEDAREDLRAIGTALNHLSNLSAGMRLMALDPRRENDSTAATDLVAWFEEVRAVLSGVLPRGVTLTGHVQPGLGVRMPRHRLTQAVFNLVQNAGEAIAASAKHGDAAGVVRLHVQSRGGDVLIIISDNGPGMPEEVAARCFEPYFSTKGRAISTGMGLSLVRGLVEGGGGAISVESSPGKGATFTIRLPAVDPTDTRTPVDRPLRHAAVSISDARTAAIAGLILERLNVKTVMQSTSNSPEADIWLVQGAAESSVREFLSHAPSRRIVAIGDGIAGFAGSAEASQIVLLPLRPTPTALRDAIADAIDSVTPGEAKIGGKA